MRLTGPPPALGAVASPAPRPVWDEIAAASDDALAFHTPAWLDCVCAADGWQDASRLYRLADGRPAILPLVRRSLGGGLRVEASLPYGWGFGGLVCAGRPAAHELEAILGDLARGGAGRAAVRPSPLVSDAWAAAGAGVARVPRCAHVLDLGGGYERVWAERFAGTARTAVRKAERSGLSVEVDTTGRLVAEFAALYRLSIERWARAGATPAWLARRLLLRREPPEKLAAVAARLGGACQVWVARQDERPAAGLVVLRHGRAASYWRGAMDKEVAAPTRASYLLHASAIEAACRDGCTAYHMGETGRSGPLAQFKTRFGAQPYRYFEYHVDRGAVARLATAVRRRGGRRA